MSEFSPKAITLALAGQPNVGKSTVFNVLTGLNQHVGNWPGKTVEQKTGELSFEGKSIRLVDLPGTYSLTANSEEERIARDFILRERPDVIVVIANAAALERGLYLLAELLSLPQPLVIGLNMMDVAEQHGIQIEPPVLEAALNAPVIPLVASCNQGVSELIQAALRLAENPSAFRPRRPEIRPEHRPVLREILTCIAGQVPPPYPEDWTAIKLLEGDAQITALVRQAAPQAWERIHPILMRHEDAYLDIAGGRYEWISRLVRAAVVRPRASAVTLTDRLDKVATHPVWGLLLLLGIFGLTFWLTYALATPLVNGLDHFLGNWVSPTVRGLMAGAPAWFSGLVVDGLIGGAGTVLAFLPILAIFFAVLGLLEDVGYLTRTAYVMDRFMHWMGLHGKSFLPLFLGFGCNVPAVMGTRIIEDRRARLLTILLVPLMPCTGRLAVITFLAPAFFGPSAAMAVWALLSANILVLLLIGIVINRIAFKGERSAFVMEMPLYHLPNGRTIFLFVWNHILAFVRKAGTVIVIVSAIVWALAALPDGNKEHSFLAHLGRSLTPLGQWMGLSDWRLIVALLTSFVAKENTIATLGVLYGANGDGIGLAGRVASSLSYASGFAFLVVQMLFVPCAATLVVIHQEAGWKKSLQSLGLMLALSVGAGVLVYQLLAL